MKGKGSSWSRTPFGCSLRFYGWTTGAERALALWSAHEVEQAVKRVVPEAHVAILDDPNQRMVLVQIHVDAEDLAVFKNGPIHRVAVAKASNAASRTLDTCRWARVRLAQPSPKTPATPPMWG